MEDQTEEEILKEAEILLKDTQEDVGSQEEGDKVVQDSETSAEVEPLIDQESEGKDKRSDITKEEESQYGI